MPEVIRCCPQCLDGRPEEGELLCATCRAHKLVDELDPFSIPDGLDAAWVAQYQEALTQAEKDYRRKLSGMGRDALIEIAVERFKEETSRSLMVSAVAKEEKARVARPKG